MFGKKIKNEEHSLKTVIVFSSGNPSAIVIAKSILEDCKIPYIIKNEVLQNLFGLGNIGGVSNALSGPVEISVREEDAEVVLKLLEKLN